MGNGLTVATYLLERSQHCFCHIEQSEIQEYDDRLVGFWTDIGLSDWSTTECSSGRVGEKQQGWRGWLATQSGLSDSGAKSGGCRGVVAIGAGPKRRWRLWIARAQSSLSESVSALRRGAGQHGSSDTRHGVSFMQRR